MAEIDGGFIFTPRKLNSEWLIDQSPLRNKMWNWMMLKACFSDSGSLKRGQLFVSNKTMIEIMSWKTGSCIHKPTINEIRSGYEAFKKQGMITTRRTSRGNIITICNYDKIHNISSYQEKGKVRVVRKTGNPITTNSGLEAHSASQVVEIIDNIF